MKTMRSMMAIVGIIIAGLAVSTSAQAQVICGFHPQFGPIPCAAPVILPPPPPPMPVYGAPVYGGMPMRADPGMGVNLAPLGPVVGGGVTAGLSGMGVPAPIAGWAGDRVNANAAAAGRERNAGDAAIRTFTGVSPRDIQEHGWRGGPNSEVNKVLGFFGR